MIVIQIIITVIIPAAMIVCGRRLSKYTGVRLRWIRIQNAYGKAV